MSRAKQELIARLRTHLGASCDPADVIEALYESGAIDDVLACRHNIREGTLDAMSTSTKSEYQIHLMIGEHYGRSRSVVQSIAGNSGK